MYFFFFHSLTGAGMMSVRTAAVVGNDKQHQLLLIKGDADVSEAEQHGGCDDGRVINCRILPIFNYTELSLPPGPETDLLQGENCPWVSKPWKSWNMGEILFKVNENHLGYYCRFLIGSHFKRFFFVFLKLFSRSFWKFELRIHLFTYIISIAGH